MLTQVNLQPRDWVADAHAIAADIAPLAAAHDAEERFVAEGFARLKAAGFFKALVPEHLGGGGAEFADIFAAIRVLGAACGSTALAFSMHTHLVATAAWRLAHQSAPTEGLLRRVAAEDLILVSSGGSDRNRRDVCGRSPAHGGGHRRRRPYRPSISRRTRSC